MAALHSATVRNWPVGLRVITILFLVISAFGPAQATPVYADKLVCGVPGKDGPASISGIVNTYYPGTANVSASSTTIPVGSPSGAAAPIQAGDLLLVIQMQGADINSTNTSSYGDGDPSATASGILGTNFSAGQYEYVIATSGVSGGSVSISSGLVNNYFNQDYSGSQGQRRFQVVRVPQYSSATVVGAVTSLAWNGSVGGVAALDVAGTLNFNGNSVNVNGQGFRGGGGVRYTGDTSGAFAATDYRTPSTATLNASKGEGIAGTPRFVFNGTSVVDLTVEGYPNGSFARALRGMLEAVEQMGTRPGMKITPGVEAEGMAAPVDWAGSAGVPSATAEALGERYSRQLQMQHGWRWAAAAALEISTIMIPY